MEMMFLVQMVVYFLIVLLLGISFLEPLSLFGFSWAISALLLASGFLEFYHEIFTPESFYFLSAGIWAFFLGAMISRITSRYRSGHQGKLDFSIIQSKNWRIFFDVFVIFYGLAVVIGFQQKIILIGSLGDVELTDLRVLHWEGYLGIKGLIPLFTSVCRPFNIIRVIFLPLYPQALNKVHHLLFGSLALAFIIFETFSEGGRGLIVFVGVAAGYCFLFYRYKGYFRPLMIFRSISPKLALFISGILVVSIYLLAIWFPKMRNPRLLNNYDYYLGYSARAALSLEAKNFAKVIGEQNALPFLTSLGYFTGPIPTLTYYFTHSNFTEWYYLGSYNFPIFSKFFDILLSQPYSWSDIRVRLSSPLAAAGFADNPWGTGFRDLIVDFGLVGAVIAAFLLGLLTQNLYHSTLRTPSAEKYVLLSLSSTITVVFGFYGYIHNGFFAYTLLAILAIALLRLTNRVLAEEH